MTKRIVTTIVLGGLILGSVDAFASRARENVMGRGDAGAILNSSGSMYYDSMYNIFYNPAYINDFKNWAIVEKGANNASTNVAAPPTGNTTSHNEGGFATNMMNFNVGVFFNRVDAFNTPVGTAPAGALALTSAAGNTRPIDLVVGGDMGVKWGVGVTHASANALTAGQKENNLTLRAGASIADFDPFISYRLVGKVEQAGVPGPGVGESKTSDMTLGLRYHYGEWTPYAAYRMGAVEETGVTNGGDRLKLNSYVAGVARNVKLGEGARLVYSVAYASINVTDIKNAAAANGEGHRKIIPVDMALEGDVASWVTLRAGLGYRLMDRTSGTQAGTVGGTAGAAGTMGDSVTGRVGATIHANKFDFDWAFGTSAAPSTAATNLDTSSFGFDSGTFTNASLSYKW